ncbi:MAG: ferric iron uptake transcriptional regulator [Burkholderiaceae bacterium]|jgi:Fur family ferric uptake transcriptional regulator|nr:ferric iron uptake transcriptional regulator [Burkholderiaceae bacterium]
MTQYRVKVDVMGKQATEVNNPAELKASGLKATQPRLKILEAFQQNPVRHLTADEVYRLLLAERIEIGLATVYRVLTQFEQAGLLSRRYFETGKAVYELNEGDHHDHIVCLHCGRVAEFHDDQIELRQREIARQQGFNMVDHSLAIYGYCANPDCSGEG